MTSLPDEPTAPTLETPFRIDPDLDAFLPIVYVLWADGALSPEERGAVRGALDRAESIPDDVRTGLQRWIDPASPPPVEALEAVLARVKELCGEAGPSDCTSLADLGREMARRAGRAIDGSTIDALLGEMADELQIVGREAARSLLGVAMEGEDRSSGSGVDADGLHRYVDASYWDTRDAVLDLLHDPAFDIPVGTPTPEYRQRVLDAVRLLAERGIGALAYPEAYGGTADPGAGIAAFETLAYGDTSVLVKFGVQFGLWGGSVQQLGTEHHHERYLRRIGSLDLPGCYAMTELGHGSNVRDIETVATYDVSDDTFVIDSPTPGATKWWIGNAALHGKAATVFAQLRVGGGEHGVHAFVVPIRDEDGRPLPGVTIEDCGEKVGLNGIDNGTLRFDEVRIPRENLLDRFAYVTPEGRYESPIPGADRRFFTMLGTLVAGRISIAAASVSIAKVGLTTAVRYADRRTQFGPAGGAEVPILDYRVVQRQLLPRVAAAYGLTFAVRKLADGYVSLQTGERDERAVRELEVFAAALKAYASDFAVGAVQASREACGGQGYLAANRLGRLRNDVDIFTTFEGANNVLLQLAAKGLLSRYRDEMGDLKFWGIVRYIADQAGTRVTELNPVIVRKTDEEHLLDPEFHKNAFAYREERLLSSAARRLKSYLDDGVDSFEALNRTQDHLVSLALAHVERRIVESFIAGVEEAPEAFRAPLAQLEQLFALERLEAHGGWFQESGYMEGVKTRAIRAQVNRLVGEIRPDAVALVDGFGIPDRVLRAPAGVREGNAGTLD